MNFRYYSDSFDDAALIIKEIESFGKSEGWSGSLEELNQLKEILSKLCIIYTDDMLGRWERKPK